MTDGTSGRRDDVGGAPGRRSVREVAAGLSTARVAELARLLVIAEINQRGCGSGGWGFESLRARHV